MSDLAVPVAETTPTPVVTSEEPKAQDAPKVFDEAYVKGLRSEAASYRARLKDLEAAEAARKAEDDAKKLAELSEVERLKAQLADMSAKARTLEIEAIRTKAAIKHNLPDDLHEFLTAEDEAGALAQAEKLAAKLTVPNVTTATLPGAGGRAPAHTDKPKGFTPEEQRENDKRLAARW